MKRLILLITVPLWALCPVGSSPAGPAHYTGAWQNRSDAGETICLEDGYFVFAKFNTGEKKFHYTWGGPCETEEGRFVIILHFDSRDKSEAGKKKELLVKESNGQMIITEDGQTKTFIRMDDGSAPLAGNWRITGRKQGEVINPIPLRARRTYKLLTATRFQWMAINIETGEFSGTGGGHYTFKDGKYTEHIEFFSRDSSRVGASLSFDGKLEDGKWHHSGLSSRGDPVYEIWERTK